MKKKIDVSDGIEVANFFVSDYLNNLCFHEKPFLEKFKQERKEIQENFTFLAFGWLHALASTSGFDDRNEGAVMMARDICLHVPEVPKLNRLSYDGEMHIDVDRADEEQVSRMMAGYLMADSKNAYQDFLLYACTEHRTLQQTLTRLFREWLLLATECKAAQAASAYIQGHRLPLI